MAKKSERFTYDAVFSGGIETISVAGVPYWFGFDFRADCVTTDPVPTAKEMTAIARARSVGALKKAAWDELAEWAETSSELASDKEDRDLAKMGESLLTMARTNKGVRGFLFPHHLEYMLGASSGWGGVAESAAAIKTLKKLGFEPTQLGEVLGWKQVPHFLSGKKAPPPGVTIADVAGLFLEYFAHYQRRAPEAWRDLFAPLWSGSAPLPVAGSVSATTPPLAKTRAAAKKATPKRRATVAKKGSAKKV